MANKARIDFELNYKVNQQSLNQVRQSLQSLQNLGPTDLGVSVEDTSKLSKAQAAIDAARASAQQLDNALQKAFDVDLGTVNLAKFNQELKNINIQGVYNNFSKLGAQGKKVFYEFANSALNVNTQFKTTNNLLDKMATSLSNTIIYNISQNTLNAVTGSINQAIGYVKNLDSSLNDIRIVTGASADEMERFAVQANKAAQELGASTKDIAEGALIYYQQGDTSESAMYKAQVTQKAANISGVDPSTMSDYLTAIWNGYEAGTRAVQEGMQVYDSYADKVASVAATTAADFGEIATAMGKVAPLANSMGISFDQLTAQISAVVSVTRQAPETVGTAFRTIYTRMADLKAGGEDEGVSLGKVSGGLASYGINVLDSTGNLRDMGDVIDEVAAKWDTWDKATQQSIAVLVAGTRQVNIFTSLMEGWESQYLPALDTAVNKSEGALQDMQDIYEERVSTMKQKMETAWEGVYDSLIDEKFLKDFYSFFAGLGNAVEKVIDAFGGGKAVIPMFVSLLGQIAKTKVSQEIAGIIVSVQQMKQELSRQGALQDTVKFFTNINADTTTKEFLKMSTSLTQFSDLMTEEQKQIASNLQNQAKELAEVKTDWEETQQAALEYYKSLSYEGKEEISNIGQLGKDNTQLQLKEADIQKVQGYIKTALGQISSFGIDIGKNLGSNLTESLTDQINAAPFDAAITAKLQSLSEQLLDIETNPNGVDNKARLKVLEEINTIYEEQRKKMQQLTNAADNFKTTQTDIENGEKTLQNQADGLQQQLKVTFNTQQVLDYALFVSSITGSINTVTNAFKTWGDESATAGQKISTISAAFISMIPVLTKAISSFKTLKTAEKAATDQAELLAIANAKANLILLAITVAITVVTAVVSNYKSATEKATEAMHEANDAYKESQQKLESLKSKLEDVTKSYNDLIEASKESPLTVNEKTKLKQLEAERNELERQVEIQEILNKAAKENAEFTAQKAATTFLNKQVDSGASKTLIEKSIEYYENYEAGGTGAVADWYSKTVDKEKVLAGQESLDSSDIIAGLNALQKQKNAYELELEKAVAMGDQNSIEFYQEQIDDLAISWNNASTAAATQIEYLQSLQENLDPASDEYKQLQEWIDALVDTMSNLDQETQEKAKTGFNSLFTADTKKNLQEKYSRTGVITKEDILNEIGGSNFEDWRKEQGLSSETADTIMQGWESLLTKSWLVQAEEEAKKIEQENFDIGEILGISKFDGVIDSGAEFSAVLKNVSQLFSKATTAAEEYISTGRLSINTATDLIDANEDYYKALTFTEKGVDLDVDQLRDIIVDDSMQKIRDSLSSAGKEQLGLATDDKITEKDRLLIQYLQEGAYNDAYTITLENGAKVTKAQVDSYRTWTEELEETISVLEETEKAEYDYKVSIAKHEAVIANANTRISTWTSKMNQLNTSDFSGQLIYLQKAIDENTAIVAEREKELQEVITKHGVASTEATEAYNQLITAQESLKNAEQDRINKMVEVNEWAMEQIINSIDLAQKAVDLRSKQRSKYDYTGIAQDAIDTYENERAKVQAAEDLYNKNLSQGLYANDELQRQRDETDVKSQKADLESDRYTRDNALRQNAINKINQETQDKLDDWADDLTEITNQAKDIASDDHEARKANLAQQEEIAQKQYDAYVLQKSNLEQQYSNAVAAGDMSLADSINDQIETADDNLNSSLWAIHDLQKEQRAEEIAAIGDELSDSKDDIERNRTITSNARGQLEDYQYDERIAAYQKDSDYIQQEIADNNAAIARYTDLINSGLYSDDQIKTIEDAIEALTDSNISLSNSIDTNTKTIRDEMINRAKFDRDEALDESNLQSSRISNQIKNLQNDSTSNNELSIAALNQAEMDEAERRLQIHKDYIEDLNDLRQQGLLTEEKYNELIEEEAENYESAKQAVIDAQQAVSDAMKSLQDNAKDAWETAKSALENYIDNYLSDLKEKVDDAKDALDDYKDALQDLWDAEDKHDERQEKLEERAKKAQERATSLTAAASGDLSALANVRDLDEQLAEMDKELEEDIIQDIRDALLDYIDDQKEALEDMYDLQEEWFEEYKESATFFKNINSLAEGKGINVSYLGRVNLAGIQTANDKRSGDYYAPDYESTVQARNKQTSSYQDYMSLTPAARTAIATGESWTYDKASGKYISDSGAEIEAEQAEIIDNLQGLVLDSGAIVAEQASTNEKLDAITEWMESVGLGTAIESFKKFIEDNNIDLNTAEGRNQALNWFDGFNETSLDWLKELLGIPVDDTVAEEETDSIDIIEKYSLEEVFNGQWGKLQSIDETINKMAETLSNNDSTPINLTVGNMINVEGNMDEKAVSGARDAASQAAQMMMDMISGKLSANGVIGLRKNR